MHFRRAESGEGWLRRAGLALEGATAAGSFPVPGPTVLAAAVDAVTAVLQVLAFGGVVSQIDRAVIGGYGFLAASELVEQVRAGGSGGLEAAGVLEHKAGPLDKNYANLDQVAKIVSFAAE